jgi:hypothetical protein
MHTHSCAALIWQIVGLSEKAAVWDREASLQALANLLVVHNTSKPHKSRNVHTHKSPRGKGAGRATKQTPSAEAPDGVSNRPRSLRPKLSWNATAPGMGASLDATRNQEDDSASASAGDATQHVRLKRARQQAPKRGPRSRQRVRGDLMQNKTVAVYVQSSGSGSGSEGEEGDDATTRASLMQSYKTLLSSSRGRGGGRRSGGVTKIVDSGGLPGGRGHADTRESKNSRAKSGSQFRDGQPQQQTA